MRYIVRRSYVDVVGELWMPNVTAASRIELGAYDIENMTDDDGAVTRDSVEQWLMCHSGDYSRVLDFAASIELGDTTVDIPWTSEESECTYSDCMYPSED